jgi:DNA-binding NarL/FixJ family response regulator
MKKHSVVIVEDHTLLSQAIEGMVNQFKDFEVLYLCKNGQFLIDQFSAIKDNIPDIVLMDINMPIMSGIETTQWLSLNHPQVKVLALSIEDEEYTILKMLRAGAIGYLLKDTEKTILEQALLDIVKFGYYHSTKVTSVLTKYGKTDIIEPQQLKKNELIFLKMACTELTYKEIADKMCLSPKTIDGYRDALFDKLNVKNRVSLVVYAIKNKIYTL